LVSSSGYLGRSDASIYIDGELVEQGSLGTPAGYDDSNEDIGQYAGSYNYNGILDEVKIYSAALTADQLSSTTILASLSILAQALKKILAMIP